MKKKSIVIEYCTVVYSDVKFQPSTQILFPQDEMSRDNSCGNPQTQFDFPNQLKNLGCYWIQLLENKVGGFIIIFFPPFTLGEKNAQRLLTRASTQQWKESTAFLIEIGEDFVESKTLIKRAKDVHMLKEHPNGNTLASEQSQLPFK